VRLKRQENNREQMEIRAGASCQVTSREGALNRRKLYRRNTVRGGKMAVNGDNVTDRQSGQKVHMIVLDLRFALSINSDLLKILYIEAVLCLALSRLQSLVQSMIARLCVS
jgi:hypothetical protein